MEKKVRERNCQHCNQVVRYSYGETPQECPFCGSPYWNKPREEYKLFSIQDEYIDSGMNKEKLIPMYEVLVFYAENIIKKAIKGKILFSPEVLNEKAQDVALNFFEMYFKKEGYVVKTSFGGILSKISLGVLYDPKIRMADESISLDIELNEKNSLSDIAPSIVTEEEKEKFSEDVYQAYDKNNPLQILDTIEDVIRSQVKFLKEDFSKEDAFLFLSALCLRLRKRDRNCLNEFYDYYGDTVKQDIDNTLDLVRRELI